MYSDDIVFAVPFPTNPALGRWEEQDFRTVPLVVQSFLVLVQHRFNSKYVGRLFNDDTFADVQYMVQDMHKHVFQPAPFCPYRIVVHKTRQLPYSVVEPNPHNEVVTFICEKFILTVQSGKE